MKHIPFVATALLLLLAGLMLAGCSHAACH